MRKLTLVAGVSALALLTGCVPGQTPSSSVYQSLAQLGNTAVGDLQTAENVANAATPPDTAGVTCAAAAITAIGYIQNVNAAANSSNAGLFTAAEMASLFQPGSVQYQQVVNTVGTGCVAKANNVLGAARVIALGGVMAVLPQILPLAAAAP